MTNDFEHHVRLDDDQAEILLRAAHKNGLTVSEYIRETLKREIDANPPPPRNVVVPPLIKKDRRFSAYLSQKVRLQIERVARRDGLTKSAWIRRAVMRRSVQKRRAAGIALPTAPCWPLRVFSRFNFANLDWSLGIFEPLRPLLY